jgi:hypothetical protein
MKTLIKFLYLVACAAFIIACDKTDQLADEFSGVSLKSATSDCPVFIVYPNGTDDTGPLMQAFADAKNAGPGSVVQLVEGEYFIGFIEIREFTGSFIGAGIGKTIITVLTGLDCDNITIVEKQFTYVLKYIGGDVYVADLTFLSPSGGMCSTGIGKLSGFLEFSDYQTGYNSLNMYIKACVNNVEFIGQPLTVNGLPNFNISKGIRASSDSNGPSNLTRSNIDIAITNCSFETIEYAVQYTTINNGSLVLGKQSNGNSFSGCKYSSQIYDIINVTSSVAGNLFDVPKDGVGLWVTNSKQAKFINEFQQRKTVCNVERNSFKTAEGGKYAIDISDQRRSLGEQFPMLVQLKNNTFELEGGASVGINSAYLKGMVIRNNQFKGSSTLPGLRIVGAGTTFNEDGLMLGNNFSNFTSSLYSVLLNNRTRNWSIVGGDLGESVYNLGENNIITGMNVNTSEVPLGETISDNLEEMRDGMNF